MHHINRSVAMIATSILMLFLANGAAIAGSTQEEANRKAVLAFYESAYQAGARLAGWNTARLTCPGGVTDPLRSPQWG